MFDEALWFTSMGDTIGFAKTGYAYRIAGNEYTEWLWSGHRESL